jgi:abelson tyrosine-protein kinase 1
MACLHLAERCAGVLSSIQTEVAIAGAAVAATLHDPMESLIATFTSIEILMQKFVKPDHSPFFRASHLLNRLAERPFIKRYLKREETQRQILEAHEKLTDDLQLFSVSFVPLDPNTLIHLVYPPSSRLKCEFSGS